MIQAIVDNPYRILGVYANAKDNEILESAARLISNPSTICETDFNISDLPRPRRDIATINWAKQKVLDAKESVQFKLFWFMKSPDNVGYDELLAGDVDKANDMWFFSSTDESNHNEIVADLIQNNYALAAYHAYNLLFKQGYRTNILKTNNRFQELIDNFKQTLFDESNSSYAPVGFNGTWKRYVQEKIYTDLSRTITTYYLEKAKLQIKQQNSSSYLSALSLMSSSRWYLYALKEFVGVNNDRYNKYTYELSSNVLLWIKEYLSSSKDYFKYKNVSSIAFIFSSFTPDTIQSSYLIVLGYSMQCSNNLQILPETCHLCINTASVIYSVHLKEEKKPSVFISVIRQTAPIFIALKKLIGESHECYKHLANFLVVVGLSIIAKELSGDIEESTVVNCSNIIGYIDRVIDGKLLYDSNRNNRNRYMNYLCDLGLQGKPNSRFPHVLGKVDYDFAIYLDEDTTFKYYCSSLSGCQNYLMRFPNGKYVKEVQAMILGNKYNRPNTNTSTNTTRTTPQQPKSSTYNQGGGSSSNNQQKRGFTIIGLSRLYKFIIIALFIEILCGFLFGNKPMLIIGLFIVFGYWLVVQTSDKRFDNSSRKLMYAYFFGQLIITILGLILLR